MSVSRRSIDTISAIAATKRIRVLAAYITAGPTIIRTAFRSLVARDIRSPVRRDWKYDTGRSWRPREEVVPEVVLDVPGDRDDDAPHEEPEDGADQGDGEEGRGVERQLAARDAGGQAIHGEPQHPRGDQRHARRHRHTGESDRELTAVAEQVRPGDDGAREPIQRKYHTGEAADIESPGCTRSTSSSPSSASWSSPTGTTARSSRRRSSSWTTRARRRRIPATTATTSTRPRAGSSSDTTSPPSPAPDLSSAPCWPPSSATRQASSGWSQASCWPGRSTT